LRLVSATRTSTRVVCVLPRCSDSGSCAKRSSLGGAIQKEAFVLRQWSAKLSPLPD
jgi:hypothetical protein